MKRRDLLKGAGALVLGAPAVHASGLLNSNTTPQGQTKDLVVAFAGPFCFWQSPQEMPQGIKVMAPPVGPDNKKVPHQPWTGTTTNQKVIKVDPGTKLTLVINGFSSQSAPVRSGTPSFPYEQGAGSGATPLFNLFVPIPNVIIGVRPTVAKMVCAAGVTDPYCTQYGVYASGWSFVYKNVDLSGVVINGLDQPFVPCFTNDDSLQEATLGVHLTPMDQHPDPAHTHAKEVWNHMLSMYPWMQKEIIGIKFCHQFDPASCNFDPSTCTDPDESHTKAGRIKPVGVGPGSDCEAPLMEMGPPGAGYKHGKR